MKIENELEILIQLREFLDDKKYSQIISNLLLVNGVNELVQVIDYNKMSRIIFNADNDIKDLMKIFLQGLPIRRDSINIIPKDLLDGLIRIGILKNVGPYIKTNNLLIIKVLNKLLIVDIPYYFPTCEKAHTDVYVGLDSYMLMLNLYEKLQLKKYSKAIDICCGSGLQAVIASDYVKYVEAIELNTYAAKIARYNTYLNRCDNRVSIINKNYFNLKNPLQGYDLIISNPPFLPITDELKFSVIGNGGDDGMRFLKRILCDFKKIETYDAEGIFIGECFGTEKNSDLLNLLNALDENLSYTVLYTIKSCTENVVNRIAHMISAQTGMQYKTAYNKITSCLCKDKLYYYTYIVEIKNHSAKNKLIDIANKWKYSDVPIVGNRIKKEQTGTWYVRSPDGVRLQISNGFMRCLNGIDGKLSLAELMEKNFPYLSLDDTTEKLMTIFAELQRLRLIEKGI